MAYPSLTYRGTANSTTDSNSYTFSGNAIGTASDLRAVFVFVYADALSGSLVSNSANMTIGGVTATRVGVAAGAAGTVQAFVARVPTGTTADILVNFTDTMTRCAVVWYTFKPASTSAYGAKAAAGTGTSIGFTALPVVTNGVVLIAAMSNGSSYTGAWSGSDTPTSNLAVTGIDSNAEYITAVSIQTTATSSYNYTVTSGTSIRRVILGMSFDVEGQLTDTLAETVQVVESTLVPTGATLADNVRYEEIVLTKKGWGVSASDAIGGTETLSFLVKPGAIVGDTVGMADAQATTYKFVNVVTERGGIKDRVVVGIPRTLSDTVGISRAVSAARATTVLEGLGLLETLLPQAKLGLTQRDGFRITDSLIRFFGGDIVEGLGITDLASRQKKAIASSSETVALSETLTRQLIVRVSARDAVGLTNTQILKLLLKPTLAEGIELAAAYVSPSDSVTTWAVNTKTGAVTEYTNYNFNSFAQIGHKYLGATSSGLYELNGDNDAGTNIIAHIKSGYAQFGGSRFSSFKAIYLGMRGNGSFVLKVISGDGQTYNYAVVGKDMQTSRVHLGKGLRARYFAFELLSTGQDFDLDDIEFVPLVAQRRV